MKFLVTGGAGFIGSHLVERCLASGETVVVVDNFSTGREKNVAHLRGNKNLKLMDTDITGDLTEIFRLGPFDGVFHLAALPRVQFSIDFPIEAHNVNVNGTLNLLQACRNFGVKRFIFSSSSSVYGAQKRLPLKESVTPEPMAPYPLQKLTAERYCQLYYQLYGVEVIILRYFSVYGPRQNPEGNYAQVIAKFIGLASRGENLVINGDGRQTRDFTFVTDVVEANILAVKARTKKCFGEVFNVGRGDDLSVNAIAKQICKLSGKRSRIVYGPALIEAKNTLADFSKARRLLGWQPRVSFAQGVKQTFDSMTRGK